MKNWLYRVVIRWYDGGDLDVSRDEMEAETALEVARFLDDEIKGEGEIIDMVICEAP